MANPDTEQLLLALEHKLHQPESRSDTEILDKLLDDSFVEFGASGKVFTKREIISSLVNDPELNVIVEDEKVRCIENNVFLVTYRTRNMALGVRRASNRSSIWKKTNEGWKMVFHQGTVIDGTEK